MVLGYSVLPSPLAKTKNSETNPMCGFSMQLSGTAVLLGHLDICRLASQVIKAMDY